MGHFREWRRIGADGSLSPDSFRAGRMPATERVGHKPTSRLRLEMNEESWIAELGARNAPLVQTVVPFVASDSCLRILRFGPPLTRPGRPGRRKPTWDQADFHRPAVS
jgi:hypothetical protein